MYVVMYVKISLRYLLILTAKNATANELQYLSNKTNKQTEILYSYIKVEFQNSIERLPYNGHQNCLDKSLSGECVCSFEAFLKQLQYSSNTLWRLPVCSPPKTVSICNINFMKKTLHKQLSRGASENVQGEVQYP